MLSLYCPIPIHQDQGGLGTCLLKVSPPKILKSRSKAISGEIRKTYALHRNDFTTYDDEWAYLKMELGSTSCDRRVKCGFRACRFLSLIFKNNTFSVICLRLTIFTTNLIHLVNMELQNFDYINPLKRDVFPPKELIMIPSISSVPSFIHFSNRIKQKFHRPMIFFDSVFP